MRRQEFEQWLKENKLKTIHTYSGEYSYSPNIECVDVNHYGIIFRNDKWVLESILCGDRGPYPGYILSGTFDTEEDALDSCKNQLLGYAAETYSGALKTKIMSFYSEIVFKKIPNKRNIIANSSCNYTFDEYIDLIRKYFPGDFYADAEYGSLKVYSTQFHSLLFEIISKRDLGTNYFIPMMLIYDGKRFVGNHQLDSTFSEWKEDKDGFYVLYYNSLTAFEKYDDSGNLLYSSEWTKECNLRTYSIFIKFTNSSFFTNGNSYAPRNPIYPDNTHIAISNGLQYAIFERKTGKLVETNYDMSKDIPK